jgi:hypothetical protein
MNVVLLRRPRTCSSIHNISLSLTTTQLGRRTLSNTSATHQQVQPLHETASFEYLENVPLYRDEKPFSLMEPVHESLRGQRTSNLVWKWQAPQRITDMRGQESKFDLDKHGFAVRDWPTKLSQREFDEPDLIEHVYLPEIYDLVKTTVEGADLVINTHFQV